MSTNEFYGLKYLIKCQDDRWHKFYNLHHVEEKDDVSVLYQRFSRTFDKSQELIEFARSVISIYEDGLSLHEYTVSHFSLQLLDKIEAILGEYLIVKDRVAAYIDILRQGEMIFGKYLDIGRYSNTDIMNEIGRVNILFYKYFNDFINGMYYSVLKIQQKIMEQELSVNV